jgi:hypothetical protein
VTASLGLSLLLKAKTGFTKDHLRLLLASSSNSAYLSKKVNEKRRYADTEFLLVYQTLVQSAFTVGNEIFYELRCSGYWSFAGDPTGSKT